MIVIMPTFIQRTSGGLRHQHFRHRVCVVGSYRTYSCGAKALSSTY